MIPFGNNWKIFVEKERHTVIRELPKFAAKRDLISSRDSHEITDNTRLPLYHPDLSIK